MQIVVQSREIIKPSSATPHHLRSLKLSLFDQFAVAALDMRILLFHSPQGDVHRFQSSNMSFLLKKSLSDTLTAFYPLAGRFSDDKQSIECDGRGVEYIEARVKAPFVFDQLLAHPEAEEVDRFFPPETASTGGLCTVQVTVFEGCGSMVIGVRTSHGFGDASALFTFVNSWAAIARGDKIVPPIFGFADVLPPRDIATILPSMTEGAQQQESLQPEQKLITGRFVLKKSMIAALTTNCASQLSRPSRVQVVCALMFKCLIRVLRSKSSKQIFLTMPISWRRRISPPLPAHHVGNFASSSIPMEITEPDQSFHSLVGQVGDMTRGFDRDHVKNILANNGTILCKNVQDHIEAFMKNKVYYLEISSWCGVPYYEADFGWGKPAWAAGFALDIENLITLLDAKDDGVEAWVTLNSQDMAKFVSEYKLILRDFGTHKIPAKM